MFRLAFSAEKLAVNWFWESASATGHAVTSHQCNTKPDLPFLTRPLVHHEAKGVARKCKVSSKLVENQTLQLY